MPLITDPKKFAKHFNQKVPGAPRAIDAYDVLLMKRCELIGRGGYYGRDDIHMVMAILKYEKLRDKHEQKVRRQLTPETLRCKGCGEALPDQPKDKRGRRREYCVKCEPSRARHRSRLYRARKKQKIKQKTGPYIMKSNK